MRKSIVALLAAVLCAASAFAQSSNCVQSSPTAFTGTAFPSQVTEFRQQGSLAVLAKPAVGSGGPTLGISSTNLNGQTGNLYPQEATLIRASDNGFWELFNGTTGTYSHTTALQWTAANPPTAASTVSYVYDINIPTKTATLTMTAPGSSTCATGCTIGSFAFRSTATPSPLGFWNLDGGAGAPGATAPLYACGVQLVMPNPIVSTISPNAGALGTMVTVTGSNFGASQGNSTVSVGGVVATTVSAWSATSISFTVPNTATTGAVIVTVNNLISNGVPFTVTTGTNPSPPVVTTTQASITIGLGYGTAQPPPPAHTVSLSWTASTSTGVTGYNVYRSTTSGSGYLKIGATTTALVYTDSTVANGATYYYVVTAIAGTNESVYSNQANVSIP